MIILIDDNKYPTQYYVEELEEEGYPTKHLRDPDTAFQFVKELVDNNGDLHAIILDIMMPPGKRYQSMDTADGLRTGVALYADLRRLCPQVPVIVLTNVKKEEDLKVEMGGEGPLLRIVHKIELLPDQLVKLVGTMIEKSQDSSAS